MAQRPQENKEYNQEGLAFLANNGAPIPGESLTNSPDNTAPWEQAPQYTELNPAVDALFLEVTEPEAYHTLMDTIAEGLPVSDLAQILLFDGFAKGMWNPDLMVLLIEPTMYLLLGLAEQAGIPEPIIYRGEENEPSEPEEQLDGLQKAIEVAKEKIIPKAKKGHLPKNIEKKLEAFEPPEQPSLLAASPVPEEGMAPPANLLDKEIE
jgi:hypothetical protein